jgi:nucleoside-diphosphate-sugar epimerase
MRVLVTGANGFVGRSLCPELTARGHEVRAAVRRGGPRVPGAFEHAPVGDIGPDTSWSEALEGVEAIVHCAARAHVLHDAAENAALYVTTNAHGTRKLAEDAARAGVRRLILLSSVKVNGERTDGRSFTAQDKPAPVDAYGESKWLAEQALWKVAAGSAMQAVVVRPPLVYGPGVRANFLRLIRWVDAGWPLPLGAIDNRRSLVSTWNLCDFLGTLLTHSAAPGRTWMASDGEDVSTSRLICMIAQAMGRQARLLSVPLPVLRAVGALAGRRMEVDRLCESLTVDVAPLHRELAWSASLPVFECISRTVQAYLAERK